MSLRLLLDEDTQSRRLTHLLREAGHDVQTATEAGLIHKPDPEVLAHSRREGRMVITRNCDHFLALHRTGPESPGILAIYQHNTPSDLSDVDVVRAVATLEVVSTETQWPLAGQFIVLNQWHVPEEVAAPDSPTGPP